MQEKIANLKEQFTSELEKISSASDLEKLRVKFLGKKGPIQELMMALKTLSSESRPVMGKEINNLKVSIKERLDSFNESLIEKEELEQLKNEKLDCTLPGRKRFIGNKHIITQSMDQMLDILIEMGFTIQTGPHIESDYYNFEALNFLEDHPARDMQDTFYITPKILLRTHTSNVQVRIMESQKPPIRIIAPGKVYRNESVSARSHVFFHQIEGFYINKGVTFVNLLSMIEEFLQKLFKRHVKTRFRPSYFPFVEPGMEVDVECFLCSSQKGCAICKQTGWLEVLGAGMVHPEVLKSGGLDPEVYNGYAWGMGVERLVMLMHGIHDIRLFTQNNQQFLSQFVST